MSHRLLGVHPLPAPVEESDKEERPPEDEVGHGDDEEHLDPRHSLLLHPLDVGTNPVRGGQTSFLRFNKYIIHFLSVLNEMLMISSCFL